MRACSQHHLRRRKGTTPSPLVLAAWCCAAWLALVPFASAQQTLEDRLESGRSVLQADEPEAAVQILSRVVKEQPTFRTREQGAAAYWLGAAHAARGDSGQAHSVWRMGMYAMANRGTTDLALIDAYVRETFQQNVSTEYIPAARAYLKLFRHADPSTLTASERQTLHRHVAQMEFLLPDSLHTALIDDVEALRDGEGGLNANATHQLARWWKRKDPRPATQLNERLVEHLQRVAEAEQHFGDESLRGFDDRGQIYVRLGRPDVRRELTSTSLARSVSSQAAFVPQNELWRYHGFGRHSHYLFVKRGTGYELAGVTDLLPSSLRHNMSGSGALAALALYDFYNALVPRVPEYFPLFDKVDDTVARLKQIASERMTTVARLADSNFDPEGSGRSRFPALRQPFFQEARRVDYEVAQIREREVPTVRSEMTDAAGDVPVSVRTARFLRPDGSTRTEVYWSIPNAALRAAPQVKGTLLRTGRLPADEHRLRLTTIRYGTAYQNREEQAMDFQFTPAEEPAHAHTFGMMLPGTSRLHHLALQWDHYLAAEGNAQGDSTTWNHAGRAVHWIDSLYTLSSDPGQLVLSDLVPLKADSLHRVDQIRSDTSFQVAPYTPDTLGTDTKLAFYVEAYHLTFDANDQTRYTVDYEVKRRTPRTGLARLVRSDEETITTASTSYSGTRRTAREYVLLDPSEWNATGTLQVTVRITDEVSGQQAKRSLAFELQPK